MYPGSAPARSFSYSPSHRTSPGTAPVSLRQTSFLTLGKSARIDCRSGTKSELHRMTLASAWSTVYRICSADRRTLTVCSTAPSIGIAKKHSRYRGVSQSMTATVSPGLTPSPARALPSRAMRCPKVA